MIDFESASRFRRLGLLTIFAVYFVILVGGIVRASGAGMGCPDWPTCFGQWIPPVEESQLPANYHEIYAARGYENTVFNPVKTWTEYTNRLVGVTIGVLVLLTAWSSRIYLKTDKSIFYLAVSVLLLICFQAWLGSAVVASNLKPLMITLHMLLALFIVALLIYAIARSQKNLLQAIDTSQITSRFSLVLKIAMLMTLLQVAMGTQVREAIDLIANQHGYIERQYWRDSFPMIFYIHRSFSAVILFTNFWLAWQIFQSAAVSDKLSNRLDGSAASWVISEMTACVRLAKSNVLLKMALLLMSLIVTAILAGISLDRLGFPAIAQPVHLLMANLIFGAQFFILISFNYSNRKH